MDSTEKNEKRREQIRKAQAKRREKLRKSGLVPIEVFIPKEMHEDLMNKAEKEGKTLSEVIQNILKVETTKLPKNPGRGTTK